LPKRQAFTCFSSGCPSGKRDETASEGGGRGRRRKRRRKRRRRRRWTKGSPLSAVSKREHLPPLNLAT